MTAAIRHIAKATRELGFQAFQGTLPYALDAMDYIPTLYRTRTGLAFIGMGAALLYKCSLIEMIQRRALDGQADAPSPRLTATRAFGVTLGLACICYGLYDLALNVSNFWEYKFGSDPTASHPLYPIASANDRKKAREVIDGLKTCPSAHQFWEHMNNGTKISVRIGSYGEMDADANWNSVTRTISLKPGIPLAENVINALFELCNAQQSKDFAKLTAEGHAGLLSFWPFANRNVQIEWRSMQCHHQISATCVRGGVWKDHYDRYLHEMTVWKTFKEFWEAYKTDPAYASHLQNLKREWLERYRKYYCIQQHDYSDCMNAPI
jgi:hypothetical protein